MLFINIINDDKLEIGISELYSMWQAEIKEPIITINVLEFLLELLNGPKLELPVFNDLSEMLLWNTEKKREYIKILHLSDKYLILLYILFGDIDNAEEMVEKVIKTNNTVEYIKRIIEYCLVDDLDCDTIYEILLHEFPNMEDIQKVHYSMYNENMLSPILYKYDIKLEELSFGKLINIPNNLSEGEKNTVFRRLRTETYCGVFSDRIRFNVIDRLIFEKKIIDDLDKQIALKIVKAYSISANENKILNEFTDIEKFRYFSLKKELERSCEVYRIKSIENFILLCFIQIRTNNLKIKRCTECGKFFYPKHGEDRCSNECTIIRNKKRKEFRRNNDFIRKANMTIKLYTNRINNYKCSNRSSNDMIYAMGDVLAYYQEICKKVNAIILDDKIKHSKDFEDNYSKWLDKISCLPRNCLASYKKNDDIPLIEFNCNYTNVFNERHFKVSEKKDIRIVTEEMLERLELNINNTYDQLYKLLNI